MKRTTLLSAAAACAVVLALAAPVVAHAQTATVPSTGTLPPAPLVKTAPMFHVRLWPERTGAALIVIATVATETPLPVRIRMPVPEGARVDWTGEILGADPEDDIQSAYRLVNDGAMLEMVLTKSRTAQYEATYVTPAKEKDLLVSRITWKQTVPASLVQFAAHVPADLTDVTVTPVSKYAPQLNQAGDRLYVVDERKMKVGEDYTYSVSFSSGEQASATSPVDTRSTVILVVLALLAVAVVALVVVLARSRRA